MKKAFLFITIICSGTILFAQSDKYTAAMKKNISLLDSAFQKRNFPELANNFERIGDAEKTQWLPYYYASYATIMSALTNEDKSKSDAIADKAEQFILKAETIAGKENSEMDVIKSLVASTHMMVDPQTRWQQYGAASASNIQKAKELDPSNPRPVYLEAQTKLNTPEAFGGGKAVAKPLFEKALSMFDTFKPNTDLDPVWGKAATEYFLSISN
ncbi:MAG: hypothetical protein ABIO55_16745 [Ginsengibacter sp.]